MTATNEPPPTAHTGTGQPPKPAHGPHSGLQAPSDTPPTDAAEDLALFVGDRLPTDSTHWPTVDNTLTALLADATVRVEWGVRVTWPDGHAEDMWGNDLMDNGQTLVEYRLEFHNSRADTSAQSIRRFVVVTAAEVTG